MNYNLEITCFNDFLLEFNRLKTYFKIDFTFSDNQIMFLEENFNKVLNKKKKLRMFDLVLNKKSTDYILNNKNINLFLISSIIKFYKNFDLNNILELIYNYLIYNEYEENLNSFLTNIFEDVIENNTNKLLMEMIFDSSLIWIKILILYLGYKPATYQIINIYNRCVNLSDNNSSLDNIEFCKHYYPDIIHC